MRAPAFDPIGAMRACRVEIARCQKSLASGTRPEFWARRLEDAAKQLEAAATLLRMELASIRGAALSDGCPHCGKPTNSAECQRSHP